MISRKAKAKVAARKRLESLTQAELTQISGGGGFPGDEGFPFFFPFEDDDDRRRRRRRRHHRHHRESHIPFFV